MKTIKVLLIAIFMIGAITPAFADDGFEECKTDWAFAIVAPLLEWSMDDMACGMQAMRQCRNSHDSSCVLDYQVSCMEEGEAERNQHSQQWYDEAKQACAPYQDQIQCIKPLAKKAAVITKACQNNCYDDTCVKTCENKVKAIGSQIQACKASGGNDFYAKYVK